MTTDTNTFRKLAGLAPTRPSLKEAVELHTPAKPVVEGTEGNPPAHYIPAPAVSKDGGEVGSGKEATSKDSHTPKPGEDAEQAAHDGGYTTAADPKLPGEVGSGQEVGARTVEGQEDIEQDKPVIKEKDCPCKKGEKKEGITGEEGYTVGSGGYKLGTITRVVNGKNMVKQPDGQWAVYGEQPGPGGNAPGAKEVGSGQTGQGNVDIAPDHEGKKQPNPSDSFATLGVVSPLPGYTPVK